MVLLKRVDSVSSLSTAITADVSEAPSNVGSSATSRVRFAVDAALVVTHTSPHVIENEEEVWYTPEEYKVFERETLEAAKTLQSSSWAKGWLKVFLILRTSKPSAKMQSAVNALALSLDETTVGLQGRYLAPILLDFKSQRHNLFLHMSMVQKQIKDPEKRVTMFREASRLYSGAPTLFAILAAHVAMKKEWRKEGKNQ